MSQVFAAVGANAVWLPFEGGPALLPLMLEGAERDAQPRRLHRHHPAQDRDPAAARPRHASAPRPRAASTWCKRDKDGTLSGDIVDGAGLRAGAGGARPSREGASVWLVGLGGAGGAIAAALCEAGVGRLLVSELDDARADAALNRLSRFYPDVPVASVDTPPKGIHYAINATPLGLRPGDPLSFDPMTLDHDVAGRRGHHEPGRDAAAAARPHPRPAHPSRPPHARPSGAALSRVVRHRHQGHRHRAVGAHDS